MASRLNAAVLIGMLALLLPHCLGLPIMATQQCQNMTEEHRGLRTFGGLDASVAYVSLFVITNNYIILYFGLWTVF